MLSDLTVDRPPVDSHGEGMGEADTIAGDPSLPRGTRADFALRLVGSRDDTSEEALTPEQRNAAAVTEAQRRWAQIESGEVETIPAANAIAAARERPAPSSLSYSTVYCAHDCAMYWGSTRVRSRETTLPSAPRTSL